MFLLFDRPHEDGNTNPDLRQELAQYIPLIAYSLLTLISGIRLWTHRIRGCCSIRTYYRFLCCRCQRYNGVTSIGNIPSAKFAFHTFLFLFATGKTIATVLSLEASSMNDNGKGSLAALIMNSLSGCSYISLLLFLETHWRDILRPLEVVKAKNYAKVMATFILMNALLYAFIGSVVYIEWVRNNGQVGSMFWSSDVIDGVLVLIAVSYTSTAIRMYRRISQSLRVQETLRNPKERLANTTTSAMESIRPKSNVQRPSISDGSLKKGQLLGNNNSMGGYDSFEDDNCAITPSSISHHVLSNNGNTSKSSSRFASFRRNDSNSNLAGERSPLMNNRTSSTTIIANAHHPPPPPPPLSSDFSLSVEKNDNDSFGGQVRNGLSLIISSNDILSRSSNTTATERNPPPPPFPSRSLSSSSRGIHNYQRSISLIPTGNSDEPNDNYEYATASSSARLYAIDGNGRQLRDALSVFITIMLSSAALLCIRTGLSLAFTGSVQNQWWYQVFVVWLPDVPPCLAYMMLMWPRDDDKRLAASSKSQLGQLFTKLLDEEDNYSDGNMDHNNLYYEGNNDNHNRGINSNLNSPLLAGLNRSSISIDNRDYNFDSMNNSPVLKPVNSTGWLENLVLKRNLSASNSSNRTGVADSITSPFFTGAGNYQAPLLVLENDSSMKGNTNNVKPSSSSPLLGGNSPTKRARGSSLVGRVLDATTSALQLRNKSNSNISLDKLSNVSGDSLSQREDDEIGYSNRFSQGKYTEQGIELPLTVRLPTESPVPVTLVGTTLNKLINVTNGFTIPCAEMRPLPSQASSLIRVSILTFSCTKVRAPPRHLLLREALRKQQYNRVQRMRRHVATYAGTTPFVGTSNINYTLPNNTMGSGNKFISLGREHSNSTTGSGTDDNSDDDRYSFELEEDELMDTNDESRTKQSSSSSSSGKPFSSQPVPIKQRSFFTKGSQLVHPNTNHAVSVMETIPSENGESLLGTTLSSSTTDDIAGTYASSYIPQSLLTRTGKTKRHTVRSRVLRIASEINPPTNNLTSATDSLSLSSSIVPPRTGSILPSASILSSSSSSTTNSNSALSTSVASTTPLSPFLIHIPVQRSNTSMFAPATPLFLPSTPLVLPSSTVRAISVSGRGITNNNVNNDDRVRRSSSSSTLSDMESDPDTDQHTKPGKPNRSNNNASSTVSMDPIVVRNGSLVTILPAESLLNRGAYFSILQSYLEVECYVVVCVGLRATRLRSKPLFTPSIPSVTGNSSTKMSNPLNDATTLAINHILSDPQNNHTNGSVLAWRYIGHTEPAYLEDESGLVSGVTKGNDTTQVDLMRMGVTLVDGEPVLSCGVGFGMSVPVPHSLIADAQEAAIALTKDAEISNASFGSSSSASPPIRFDALVRFQLRWYDGEDEDRQMRIGRTTYGSYASSSKKSKKRSRQQNSKNSLSGKVNDNTLASSSVTNQKDTPSRQHKRRGSKNSLSPGSNRRSQQQPNIPYVPGGLIVPPTNAFADLATEVCTALAVKEEEYHRLQLLTQQQQTGNPAKVVSRSRRGSSTAGASTSSNRSSRAASVAEALAILETGMGERPASDILIDHTHDVDDDVLNTNLLSTGEGDTNNTLGNNRETGRSRGASVFSMLLGGGFGNSSSESLTDNNSSLFSTDKSAEDQFLVASWTVDADSILQSMNCPGRFHVEEDNPLFTLSEQEQKALLKSRVHVHAQSVENSSSINPLNTPAQDSMLPKEVDITSPYSTASKSRRGSSSNLTNKNVPIPNPGSPSANLTVMDDHHESLAFALDDGTRTRLTIQVERIVSIRPGADLLVPGLYSLGENAYIHKQHNPQQSKDPMDDDEEDEDDDEDEDVYEESDKYADHANHTHQRSATDSRSKQATDGSKKKQGSIDTLNGTDDPDYDDDVASVASLLSGASNMDDNEDEDEEGFVREKNNNKDKERYHQTNPNPSIIQQATQLITKEVSTLSQTVGEGGSEVALTSLKDGVRHPNSDGSKASIKKNSSTTTGKNSSVGSTKSKKKKIASWLFGSSKSKTDGNDDLDYLKLGTKGSRSRITAAVLPPSNRRLDLACYSYSLELTVNSNSIVTVTNKENNFRSPLGGASALSSSTTPKRLNTVQNMHTLNANGGMNTPPVSTSGLFRAATSPYRTNPTFNETSKSMIDSSIVIPTISTELRISVVEATAESAYSAIIPRVLLPLILARRLTNLIQARNALERYLLVYTQGGNYGSSVYTHEESGNKTLHRSQSGTGKGIGGKDENITVHIGPDGSRMRSLPPPPPPKRSPFAVVSSVYGRLVGHIEREEEAKEGLNWLRNRVLYLHAYCADIAATLQGVLGLVPARDGMKSGADALPTNSYALLGIPAALTASVHTTLIAAAAAFAGPALTLSDSSIAHDAANLGDGMVEESAALAAQLEGANIAAASAAIAAIAGTPISTFRPSTRKKDAAVRWLPTNLHTQIVNMTASLSVPDDADTNFFLSSGHKHLTSNSTNLSGIYSTGTVAGTVSTGTSSNGTPPLTTVPCQPIAVASESLVTVGAPSAHIYEFSGGGGMGSKISKVQTTSVSPSLSNGRELAVNAARRDLEDAKLSLRIRADAVIVQAISAVTTSVAGSIQKALDTATAGPVAAAMVFLNNGRSCMESLPNPTQNAMRAWLRLAHESNEGMAAFRQWLALGMLISWESLLSCVGKERGMLDDMRFGAAIAGNVRYALVDAADSGALDVASGGSDAPAHSLSVEPDIFTESATKIANKRNRKGIPTPDNRTFFVDNDDNGKNTPKLPDNSDAFAENKLDENDKGNESDDDFDSSTFTGNADSTLRPVVLGTAIRVVPSGIFQTTMEAFGCVASNNKHHRSGNGADTSTDYNDINNGTTEDIFIDMTNPSSVSSMTMNTTTPGTNAEGLVFIIPIAGLRASIRAGLLPRSLLPLPGAPWPLITACPILLTQGINEMQQAAYLMGTTYLQSVINMDAIQALQHYVRAYLSHANNETLRLQAAAAEVTAAIQLARTTTNTVGNENVSLTRSSKGNNNDNNNNFIPTPLLDGPLGGSIDAEICGRLYIEYLQHSMNTGGLSPGSGSNKDTSSSSSSSQKKKKNSDKYPPPPSRTGYKNNRFLSSTNEYEDTYLNPKQQDRLPSLSDLGIIDWWGRERKIVPVKDQVWIPGSSPSSNKKLRNTNAIANNGNDINAVTSPPPITIARLAASSSALPEEIRWLAATTLAAQQTVKLNDDNNYLVSNSSSSMGNLVNATMHRTNNSNRTPTVSIQDLPSQPPKLAPLSDRAQLAATVLTALRSALFGLTNSTNTTSNNGASGNQKFTQTSKGVLRSSVSTSKFLSSDGPSSPVVPSGGSTGYLTSPLYTTSSSSSSSSSSGSPSATTSAVLSATVTGDTESEPAAILRLFEDITRILRGTRLTSCKSAKDRTGMAVTLEEARLLAQFEASTVTSISTTLNHLTSPNFSPWLPKKASTIDPYSSFSSSLYSSAQLQSFSTVGQYGPMVTATDLPGRESLTLVSRIPIAILQMQWLQIFDHLKATLPQGLALAAGTGDLNCLINKLPSTMPNIVGSITAYLRHPFIYPQLMVMQQLQQQQQQQQQQRNTANIKKEDNTITTTILPSIDVQLVRPYDMVVADIVGMANFLREYGTRLGNAEKNTGTYAFAFSAFQRAFFPVEYRAPTSVIGARVT